MRALQFSAAAILLATSAQADGHLSGDAAAGEAAFGRQCVSCHVVVDESGTTLAGRNARTGPNLYGIPGGVPGTVADFRYGDSIVAAGEAGAIWTEADFVAYTQDPTGWLRDTLGDNRARSKMSFRVRDAQDAADIYAYLDRLSAE